MNAPTDREQRFTALYTAAYDDVLRFVQRRVATGAEDVVAEAMTVAWRRADELPERLDDARAWLFGIARNCLLNSRRGERRQDALGVRLARVEDGTTPDGADAAISRVDLARAWATLSPGEQEVLALAVFDGLDSPAAGRVLGISAVAYRLRLSRARAALRRGYGATSRHDPTGPPRPRPPTARRRLQGAATGTPGATHRPPAHDTRPGPARTLQIERETASGATDSEEKAR